MEIKRATYELENQALTAARGALVGIRLEKRRVIIYKLMGKSSLLKQAII
jgi:hypothetical protein